MTSLELSSAVFANSVYPHLLGIGSEHQRIKKSSSVQLSELYTQVKSFKQFFFSSFHELSTSRILCCCFSSPRSFVSADVVVLNTQFQNEHSRFFSCCFSALLSKLNRCVFLLLVMCRWRALGCGFGI